MIKNAMAGSLKTKGCIIMAVFNYSQLSKEQRDLLNKLKTKVFGSVEEYNDYRDNGKEFPADYAMTSLAIKKNAFSVDVINYLIDECKLVEKVVNNMVEELTTSKVGDFLVPTARPRGEGTGTGGKQLKVGTMTIQQKIQHRLAQCISNVRGDNREIIKNRHEKPEVYEKLGCM